MTTVNFTVANQKLLVDIQEKYIYAVNFFVIFSFLFEK